MKVVVTAVCGCLAVCVPASAAPGQLDCGFRPSEYWMQQLRDAVARGEIDDPLTRPIPVVAPGNARMAAGNQLCLTTDHIFPFEDTDGLLLTGFSTGQLIDLMVVAANEVMTAHGDNFDFVGFWVNFVPDHQVGSAFYMGIENTVSGLGNGLFDNRAGMGLAGANIEGFVMMWRIDNTSWQPGTDPDADFTRTVLGQEFEHRWGMFLPDLLDGRELQGDGAGCGRGSHWNWKVDGQGSGMEISEWVGENPAVPVALDNSLNTDIGGVFSYPDLYLMGMVSPQELDTLPSEFRFMDDSDCSGDYFGSITPITSGEIIDAAGPRVPDSVDSQKDFRTAWVMIHQPGDPPTQTDLDKAVAILQQHMTDFNFGTLGRGTMNNQLFDDTCGCAWDLDGDGAVGIVDFLDLLAQWGTDPGGPPDFNGDGDVGIVDFLELLANWGPCI